MIRKSKANYNRSLFNKNINTPKQFWNQIKQSYPVKEEKTMTTKIFDINGSATSDKNTIVSGFTTYFMKVGKTLQASLVTLGNTIWQNHEHANLSKD